MSARTWFGSVLLHAAFTTTLGLFWVAQAPAEEDGGVFRVNRPVTAPPQFDPPRDIAIHPAPLNFVQPADQVNLNEAGDDEDPDFRDGPRGDATHFAVATDFPFPADVIAPHAPRQGGGYSGRTGGRRTLRSSG